MNSEINMLIDKNVQNASSIFSKFKLGYDYLSNDSYENFIFMIKVMQPFKSTFKYKFMDYSNNIMNYCDDDIKKWDLFYIYEQFKDFNSELFILNFEKNDLIYKTEYLKYELELFLSNNPILPDNIIFEHMLRINKFDDIDNFYKGFEYVFKYFYKLSLRQFTTILKGGDITWSTECYFE